MWGPLQRFLDRIESRLALYTALGGGSLTGLLTAWAAAATEWLDSYGPIAWVGAGFVGAFLFLCLLWLALRLNRVHAASKIRQRLYAQGAPVNPMKNQFYNERIFLGTFIPPAGVPIEGKTFEKCEIIGPINMIPASCRIESCIYVTTDHVIIDYTALKENRVKNAQYFYKCRFIDCKFYFVTILYNHIEWDIFNKEGGCNWITLIPGDQSEVELPLEQDDRPPDIDWDRILNEPRRTNPRES